MLKKLAQEVFNQKRQLKPKQRLYNKEISSEQITMSTSFGEV